MLDTLKASCELTGYNVFILQLHKSFILPPANSACMVMRSRARVCVRLFVYNALTFESLDLERSLLVCLCISRSSGQGQSHRSKTSCQCILFAGVLPSTKRQSW